MSDKDERRQLKRAWKEEQKAKAREAMLLSPADLDDLLDYLDRRLPEQPCDHSSRLTRAWANSARVEADALASSLENFGGFCDCEVLANVEPEAIF